MKFHDFLSGLAGDPEESPSGDMSAILQPFMVQVHDDALMITVLLWAVGRFEGIEGL